MQAAVAPAVNVRGRSKKFHDLDPDPTKCKVARFDPAGAIEMFTTIHAVHHVSINPHSTTIAGTR